MNKDTVIISMTTWPPRLSSVEPAYRSILRQITPHMNVHPVLVLARDEFQKDNLPEPIKNLAASGVELIWSDNLRSHKKLMPTLEKYPDNAVLVVDDDIEMSGGWLQTFLSDHEAYPNDIIYGQSMEVLYVNRSGRIKVYGHTQPFPNSGKPTLLDKPASGAAGTLFPSRTFTDARFFDMQLAMTLSPTCDESWQYCFAIIENRSFRKLSRYNIGFYLPSNQDAGLWRINNTEIGAVRQSLLAKEFPEYLLRLKERCLLSDFTEDYYKPIKEDLWKEK